MSVTETGFCVCWLLMSLTASMKVRLQFPISGDKGAGYLPVAPSGSQECKFCSII